MIEIIGVFSLIIGGPLYTSKSMHTQSKFRASGHSGEVRKERIMMIFPPMPPCHACPCITAPLPDISCSVCEVGDEAGAVAPIAAVLGEAAAAFSLSGRLNDDPYLTFDAMFSQTHTHIGLQSHK